MSSDWLTTGQASEQYGYSVVHLQDLAQAGTIKAQKIGRDWLISKKSLERHIAEMAKRGEKTGRKTHALGA